MNHADAVALCSFVEVGGGPDDGDALRTHPAGEGPEFAAGEGIDADARFVEQQDFGVAEHGAGEAEFLFHAAGEFSGRAFGEGFEPGGAQEFPCLCDGIIGRYVVQVGVEGEVFADGEIFVEAEFLRHVTDFRTEQGMVLHGIPAEDADRAGGGFEEAGEEPDQSGFPRAVRADEAQHFATGYREADARQGRVRFIRENVAQVCRFDNVHGDGGGRPGCGYPAFGMMMLTGMPWLSPLPGLSTMMRRR